MRKTLSMLFERLYEGTQEQAPDPGHALQLATAALLVEVTKADFEEQVAENEKTYALLKQHFDLTDEEAEALLGAGYAEAERVVSLQELTRQLHETLTEDEKVKVVEMLWEVAYADSNLHAQEDYLVRKIADLLYVPHAKLIQARNRVRPQ